MSITMNLNDICVIKMALVTAALRIISHGITLKFTSTVIVNIGW